MPAAAKTGKDHTILKRAGIVLVSLAGLLLLLLGLLVLFAEPLVERYLKQQVREQSQGLYRLECSDLELHGLLSGITLHNVQLVPDTVLYRQFHQNGQAGKNLFELQAPLVTITGINLRDIFFNNRVAVGELKLKKPVITQYKTEAALGGVTQKSPEPKAEKEFIQSWRFRKIELEDATYRYALLGKEVKPLHQVPRLSLKVFDLRLDSLHLQELHRKVRLDDLQLSLRNYSYHSTDSLYAVNIRRIQYSSKSRVLRAAGVVAAADKKKNALRPENEAHRALYNIRVPLLHVSGLDVTEAWEQKKLHLDKVLLDHTSLHILEDYNIPGQSEILTLPSVYARLSPYFTEVAVKELRLKQGTYSYSRNYDSVSLIHHLQEAHLAVQELWLDSASVFTPEKKAPASDLKLSTGRYTYHPHHSPYKLQVARMALSTRKESLRVEGLQLDGNWQRNDALKAIGKAKRVLYDLKVPQLSLQGMDLFRALRTSRLTVAKVTVTAPVIDVRTDLYVKKKTPTQDLEDTYNELSGILTELEVSEIQVNQAYLTHHGRSHKLQRLQQLENASLLARHLLIDKAYVKHPERQMPLQHFDVSAKSYYYKTPDNTYTFSLNRFRYSTRSQELTASDVDIKSNPASNEQKKQSGDASRNLYDLYGTRFRVSGMDLIQAFNTGNLVAREVVLQQPDFGILLDRQVLPSPQKGENLQQAAKGFFDIFGTVAIGNIGMQDGTFTYREKRGDILRTHVINDASVRVEGLQLTPDRLSNLKDELPLREMMVSAAGYVYRSADSLYTIRLDNLQYASKDQELLARVFTVRSDRAVNERLKAEKPGKASRNLFDITARQFQVTGLNLINGYATGEFLISDMLLTAPEVAILQDHNVPSGQKKATLKTDTTSSSTNEAIERLSEIVESLRVERLRVEDGTFTFHILEDTIRRSQTVAHVAVAIDALRLVSMTAADPLDIFQADEIAVLAKGYAFLSPDSLYTLEVGEVHTSMQNRTIRADSLRFRPLYPKEDYAAKMKYATDRVDLLVPSIQMEEVNLRALYNRQDIIVQKMRVLRPQVEIYRDNRIGLDPNLRPPTLQQALRKAPLYIRIDTMQVETGRLEHPVIAVNGHRPGMLLLDDINMAVYNITNDVQLIKKNNHMTADASTLLMGASRLQVHFRFQLDHPEDLYTYQGTLEPMDYKAFNPLFENMMAVRIESGQIGDATFTVHSTATEATGEIFFPYKGLKIKLLNKEDPATSTFLLKAGSWATNNLLIKTSNPTSWGNFRNGPIKVKRNKQRSVFNHMGQAMLNGIRSSSMHPMVERVVFIFIKE